MTEYVNSTVLRPRKQSALRPRRTINWGFIIPAVCSICVVLIIMVTAAKSL